MAPKKQKTAPQQTLAAAFARQPARTSGEGDAGGGDAKPHVSQFVCELRGVAEFDDFTVNNILSDASGGRFGPDEAERAEDGASGGGKLCTAVTPAWSGSTRCETPTGHSLHTCVNLALLCRI